MTNALQPRPNAAIARPSAVAALPMRQAGWIFAQGGAAVGLVAAEVWATQPELAMSVALGVGASVVNPRKVWAMPLVTAATVLGGMLSAAVDLSPVIGAGAVAGLAVAWLVPEHTDALDYVHSALGTAAGAAIGLWAAHQLLPDLVGTYGGAVGAAALTGLVGAQGLVPLALRFDAITVPTWRQINRELQPLYRPPAVEALQLYATAVTRGPDVETRRGLAEIVTWVFRLQKTLQTLDSDLTAIDPAKIQARIDCAEAPGEDDGFTRERRQATATHLRRLLDHRQLIATERTRTLSLVEYALAFLEEARAGLAIGQHLPGEAAPERLGEVLERLRTHAASGDARRKSAREVASL